MSTNAPPRPALPPRSPSVSLASAAAAALIAIGLLGSVAALFQCDGKPMEKFFVAERACDDHAHAAVVDPCPR